MSDQLEYLGETKFFSNIENRWRTWHIWSYYDETGELTAIQFGNSIDISCAQPEFKRSDCTTPLHRHLWSVCEDRLSQGLIFDEDDGVVIEPFSDNVSPVIRR